MTARLLQKLADASVLLFVTSMLAMPQANASVTGVAYACGFGNLGHFATDYQQKFGERPSDTLRASK